MYNRHMKTSSVSLTRIIFYHNYQQTATFIEEAGNTPKSGEKRHVASCLVISMWTSCSCTSLLRSAAKKVRRIFHVFCGERKPAANQCTEPSDVSTYAALNVFPRKTHFIEMKLLWLPWVTTGWPVLSPPQIYKRGKRVMCLSMI